VPGTGPGSGCAAALAVPSGRKIAEGPPVQVPRGVRARLPLSGRCTGRPGLPGLAMIACVRSRCQIGESTATARRFHVSPARLTAEAVAKAAGTR
jgi:hypothetical protein